MKKVLLMSSSRMGTLDYLEHADAQINRIFEHKKLNIVFIPYAGASFSYDTYENMVKPVFEKLGYNLKSIHRFNDPVEAINGADAIAVGGGNTFALLKRMYDAKIVKLIKKRVERDKIPYIGWSAGSNVACPTIRTTNDMPIIAPPSLDAIGLIPFQMNPHFISGKPAGHNGESREERLDEFLCINKNEELVAIKEGTGLYVEDDNVTLLGNIDGLYFKQNRVIDVLKAKSTFNINSINGYKG